MARVSEENRTTIRNLVLVLAGSLALGCIVVASMKNSAAVSAGVVTRPGDTPVVLVGDTLRFKAGNNGTGDNWQEATLNRDYYYPATYNVGAIALKRSRDNGLDGPDSDDIDIRTDKTNTPVAPNATWQVDLYTGATVVAHLTPGSNHQIHLTRDVSSSGALCPFRNTTIVRILYSTTGSCPKDQTNAAYGVTFSQIKITITGHPSPPPVPCQADGATVGTCKIVLRK